MNIKKARAIRNRRQTDYSFKTGIDPSLLSLYENGLKKPTIKHTMKINEVLDEDGFPSQAQGVKKEASIEFTFFNPQLHFRRYRTRLA